MIKAPRSLYIQRFQKFTTQEFKDVNLFSKLFKSSYPVKLFVNSTIDRVSFADAVKGSFVPCSKGLEIGPIWSTHWFRIEFEIPRECKGSAMVFVFNAECEAMIYTKEGNVVHGLTGESFDNVNRRTDYLLTKSAEGNESFLFYIEVACNGLFGAGENIGPPKERLFTIKEADLKQIDLQIEQLIQDFEVISGISRDVNETQTTVSQKALSCANEIMDCFYQNNLKRCFILAELFFESSKSQNHEVLSIGHCHIDSAWLWTFNETRRKVARSWSSQIYLMNEFPEFKFACSQAQQYEWLKQDYPDVYLKLKEKVKLGSFIPVGGTWVEFDGNLPNGESLCRQFLFGQRFFKKEFGSYCSVFWLPDTFGYTAQLPQLIKLSQMKYFFTQKLSWNNFNKFPHTSFNWVSLDQESSVLTHFCPADTYCGQMNANDLSKHITNNKDLSNSDCSMYVFGNGDGGGGPTREMLIRQRRFKNVDSLASVENQSPENFFKKLEKSTLNSWTGELYFELHRGTYTSQAKIKKDNRKCEVMLYNIEALFCLLEKKYPDLEELWKKVLLCQFHDVLPGSSIELVNKDAHKIHEDVLSKLEKILDQSGSCVFNLSCFDRREIIEVAIDDPIQLNYEKTKMLCLVDVKMFSVSQIKQSALTCTVSIKQTDVFCLENAFVKYLISKTGIIIEAFDKQNNRVFMKNGNEFLMFSDLPLFWDAWDIEFYHLNTKSSALYSNATSKILEQGPLRVIVQFEFDLSLNSKLEQLIILESHSSQLTLKTKINWNESHKLLKVQFPMMIVSDFASYDVPFGVVKRPNHQNNSWDTAKFEVCGHKFADLSEHDYGVSLLTDCKYGFSCLKNILSLSILRAPKKPDAHCDLGVHEFKYAIYPHNGPCSIETVRKGIEFNYPLLIKNGPEKQFIKIKNADSLIVESIKHEKEFIIRVFESLGARCSPIIWFWKKISSAVFVDLLEEPLGSAPLVENNELSFCILPFQIMTIKIVFE